VKKANIFASMTLHRPALERLRAFLPADAVIKLTPVTEESEPVPGEILRDKQILFCEYPPSNFEDMTDLKWIEVVSVGFEQLYKLSLPDKGIRACNARGVFDVPIAEWCIAMMVALARDLRGMLRNQDQRIWDRDARFQAEIRGATLGIWGYGGIGRETARLAKCLGLKVWALDRTPPGRRDGLYVVPGTGDPDGTLPDRTFLPDQRFEFLSGLDYLVLTMPLTPKTQGIVGAPELAALPKSAYILNPARGPIIEEAPLVDALRARRIKGAALDTHYYYPMPPDHPLWGMENVIFTPHISGSGGSPHFAERNWDIFVENVRRFLADEPLLNELSAKELRGEKE
jgi:phosphoglycerate dehydrogenase-like enzyme